jgi:hypothetical protein
VQVRINEPHVVFETFDEEVVLVNLNTGNYYSLRGSGPKILYALNAGTSTEELAEAIGRSGGNPVNALQDDLNALVCRLIEADILVEAKREPCPAKWHEPYETPLLEAYTDMQELLLLDPVHDVDADGWPKAKES